MLFENLSQYGSVALLVLRTITGIIFISSGWSHVTKTAERAKSIEMSKTFTFLLGMGELAGGAFVILGIWIQLASILLILIMAGAISTKVFKWNIGFFGEKSTGWHYDFLILSANLVFLTVGGGRYVLIY